MMIGLLANNRCECTLTVLEEHFSRGVWNLDYSSLILNLRMLNRLLFAPSNTHVKVPVQGVVLIP